MIIDLILDRKDEESEDHISVAMEKFNSFYRPICEVYPRDDVPENFRSGYVWQYSARAMYTEVFGYGGVGHEITYAMDYGTEKDVKRALCDYIDRQEYNPEIKDYINSVNWL